MKHWIAFVALFVSCSAIAAEPYIGASWVRVAYKESGFDTANPTALAVRVGAEVNPNLAVEGRLGVGLAEDTVSGIDLEVDNFYGVYVRGLLPTGTVTPYGLIGWTKGEITASAGGLSFSDSDSDLSYGVGLDAWVSKTVALNAELGRLVKGDGYKADALSFGVAVKF